MADQQSEFRRGDSVRDKATGQVLTVAEVYTPVFKYRYRCAWREDGTEHVELFRADQIEPADG